MVARLRRFFDRIAPSLRVAPSIAPASPHPDLPAEGEGARQHGEQQALKLLYEEITTRLKYLVDVGIGYLTLDRQSRTLSGGEVQRINLTTALGTSLVNTLFVLDEPSIGLHPRDMNRITEAMKRLRDAGNTLVVVEHDPAVMLAADRPSRKRVLKRFVDARARRAICICHRPLRFQLLTHLSGKDGQYET